MSAEDPTQEIATKTATALEILEGLLNNQAQIMYVFHNVIRHAIFLKIDGT